ncbi:coiled-coil domain-containing protein 150-like [Actinia tenebrosa]|uniref:Coiled-coil domain-containing protein 150-like n=1 Tax=Actinia tenebrosa TaxID=6105 RepID=A0A6P8HIW1_ACTTE|nr:coiled-coil domain-containing protein 150-like [Actinia tenebrosa]
MGTKAWQSKTKRLIKIWIKDRMLPNTAKQVQLDLLIEDFSNWQKATTDLAKENASLHSQIRSLAKQIQLIQEAEKVALEECSSLRSMADKLQATLSKRCDFEDENGRLKEQIQQMKKSADALEQEHKNQITEAIKEIEVSDQMHKNEICRLKEESQQQAKREISLLEKSLQEKDSELRHLQKQLADMARDKHTEIVKLRLEYDAKLLKLQKSNVAKSLNTPSSHSNSDIFRKKLQAAKSQSEKDIASLKDKITQLERQVQKYQQQDQQCTNRQPLSLKRKRF